MGFCFAAEGIDADGGDKGLEQWKMRCDVGEIGSDRGSEGLASSSERELNECLINESDNRIRDT